MRTVIVELSSEESDGAFSLPNRGEGSPSIRLLTGNSAESLLGTEPMVFRLTQIHSRRVLTVPEANSPGARGDGMVTDRNNCTLVVTVADCLPIFLYHRAARVCAVVHSGWRGTGIVQAAVDSMVRFRGVDRRDIEAVIGPGIGACCYDVPQERAALFPCSCTEFRFGKWYLDLRAANLVLLEESSVGAVTVVTNCTACDRRLGSYRREGPDRFSRMFATIGYGRREVFCVPSIPRFAPSPTVK